MRAIAASGAAVLLALLPGATLPDMLCTAVGLGAPVEVLGRPDRDEAAIASVSDGDPVEVLGHEVAASGELWARVSIAAGQGWMPAETLSCRMSPERARDLAGEAAVTIVEALRDRDFARVAAFVGWGDGLWFSPHPYLDMDEIVRIPRAEVPDLMSDESRRVWGYELGSGDPIESSFADYFDHYVYDRPYALAETVAFNRLLGATNAPENVFEIYPDAVVAEFYLPGSDPTAEGADWSSLRLVFLPRGDRIELVGIVHAAWSP